MRVASVVDKARNEMPEFFAGKRIQWLKELFTQMDANNDGELDNDEFWPMMACLETKIYLETVNLGS